MLITSYGIVCMILIENSMPLESFNRPSDSGADPLSPGRAPWRGSSETVAQTGWP